MTGRAGASDLRPIAVVIASLSKTQSGPRWHKCVDDAGRLDRMPGLARERQRRLNVKLRKNLAPLVKSRIELTFFPDQHGTASLQIAHVDPGRELWIAIRQDVRPIWRIDREIVDGELCAAGVNEWRAVALVPLTGDEVGHDLPREL